MKRKKSYSFLLLELLIAISLFSICVLPLTSIPMRSLAYELKTYQRMQIQRICDEAFATILAKLHQNEISWEELNVSKEKKSLILKNEPISLNIPGIGNKKIERAAYLYSSSQKEGKDSDQYRLVKVQIVVRTPQDKWFFLFKKRDRDTLIITYQVFVHQRSGLQQEKPQPPTPSSSQQMPLMA